MMSPAVDMHCHLDLYSDPELQAQQVARQKSYVLSVTTTPKAWRLTSALAAGNPRIKTALGLHPQLAKERKSELKLFDQLLPETRYVGEVGLDGGQDCRAFWKDQILVFDHVLASCASAGGRILTLHSRLAARDVLDALERHPSYGVAVLHWFSGTQRELARAVEMGCWFSVGSTMLRGNKGISLAAKMPPDRVLTETDGPFATISGKPLQPADCSDALKVLSQLWSIDANAVRAKIVASFKALVSAQS